MVDEVEWCLTMAADAVDAHRAATELGCLTTSLHVAATYCARSHSGG
ncbi:hypothetical protein DE4587_01535 [Mycobacteroides salmoniphilum]|nr:hypothetical protein DE4586_01619 [Mycobacteroides salmoniphilum]TDZ89160.1 hypothetical protein DE4587_01535 [Mycobacteroides salmoniphilum]